MAQSAATDILYEGTVSLTPGETFDVAAYNSESVYTVDVTTPLGALQVASVAGGFTYDVTDKNYVTSGALLLDNVGNYNRKDPGYWYTYVNDVYKDGYNNPAGALNLIELVDGDRVEFYYVAGISDPTDLDAVKAAATAAVKTVVDTGGVAPTDWTLRLWCKGDHDQQILLSRVWASVFSPGIFGPTMTVISGKVCRFGCWWLQLMIDPDVGPYHFNFNDDLAAQNYQVNVIAGDD